jgi:hypothetical protein
MKTLTITDAKKNLGKWLQAAAAGEDIGIISGPNIIALRKIEVESVDYALREYGVSKEEVNRFEESVIAAHREGQKNGTLEYLSVNDLQKHREKTPRR